MKAVSSHLKKKEEAWAELWKRQEIKMRVGTMLIWAVTKGSKPFKTQLRMCVLSKPFNHFNSVPRWMKLSGPLDKKTKTKQNTLISPEAPAPCYVISRRPRSATTNRNLTTPVSADSPDSAWSESLQPQSWFSFTTRCVTMGWRFQNEAGFLHFAPERADLVKKTQGSTHTAAATSTPEKF